MAATMQLLCSTGAFSRYPDYTNYQAILEYGSSLDVDGFELMFYPDWYSKVAEIGTALQASGLRFPAMHTDKNIGTLLGKVERQDQKRGIRYLEENCQLASMLDIQLLVIHILGWPELDDQLERNLSHLHTCLDIAAHYNMDVAIETIPCRLNDPLSNVYSAYKTDTRCVITLDTEFLASSQQLATAFTSEWLLFCYRKSSSIPSEQRL